jgi:lipopolysaccharide/colanic/teichoic acid biosynthesis glycosyltransferase
LVDVVRVEHGLELTATMYAYPSVDEAINPSRRDGPGEDGGSNGGPVAGGRVAGESGGGVGRNGPALSSESRRAAQLESKWPIRDLWIELAVPLPAWKRAFDLLVAAILMLALLPAFIVIVIAIRIDSPGPVIFRQTRLGRGGRPFDFFKFRSMSVDAEAQRAGLESQNEQDGPVFKMQNDPRVTRVGRILRRWSLDELPQLWNVLRGDVSLVGPRSPTPDELPGYASWQRRRLTVTGGLTCTWQVGGRSEIPFQEWMRMDIRYIERRGPLYDLWLLVKTVPAVLTGRGAH